MPTREQIFQTLDSIVIPGMTRSMVRMNLVREVRIADGKLHISLASTALSPGMQDWLKNRIQKVGKALANGSEVTIDYIDVKPQDLNDIGHVIAVMSGKGGVGKSLVTALTGIVLRRLGNEVGILDADITGPSIPKIFGISGKPIGSESGLLPIPSKLGIDIMSINLLLPSENDAVIWRGPMIGRAITQFWEQVLWGKLDYMIIDLPPGTADAPLTVLQSIPVSGIIIVFTPQELTGMIVSKAVNMAKLMNKPIIGVVENMSYMHVAELNKRIDVFGKSRGKEMSELVGAPLLAQIPLDPEIARLCDAGAIELYESEIVDRMGSALVKEISEKASTQKKK
jgi:Mrp family chromosome partitioning ATPase